MTPGDRIALEALNHRIDHTAAIARLISIHCDVGADYAEAMRGIAETLNEIAAKLDAIVSAPAQEGC